MAKQTWTIESLTKACRESTSISQVLKKLNLRPAGGNYDHIKKIISRENVDISHFTGKGWSNGKQLKEWSSYARATNAKDHLINEKGHQCECCNNHSWLEHPIQLEIHHKDGNRLNNEISNLQLLCPNCHAMTDNWRGKKNSRSIPTGRGA